MGFWLGFGIGTFFLVLFSWFVSIRAGRYHGIPRFFAFEGILLLVLLNWGVWFTDALSLRQVVSWVLLILSLWVAIDGFVTLKVYGRPGKNFEETTLLVRARLYRYIRHPLYLSLLLLAGGACLKDPGIVQLSIMAVVLVALMLTARVEEREMLAGFGDEYASYMKETRSFIPWVY